VGAANMLLLQSRGRPAKAYPATFSPATTNVGQD